MVNLSPINPVHAHASLRKSALASHFIYTSSHPSTVSHSRPLFHISQSKSASMTVTANIQIFSAMEIERKDFEDEEFPSHLLPPPGSCATMPSCLSINPRHFQKNSLADARTELPKISLKLAEISGHSANLFVPRSLTSTLALIGCDYGLYT